MMNWEGWAAAGVEWVGLEIGWLGGGNLDDRDERTYLLLPYLSIYA